MAREEARRKEDELREAQHRAWQRQQASAGSRCHGPVPPTIPSDIRTPPKQRAKNKTDWSEYIGLACLVLWIVFVQPGCRQNTLFKKTKSTAEAGDAAAQRSLGQFYEAGTHVPKNDAVAAQWYLKAAQQGDPWAQSQLGWMYSNGKGVPQNYGEAIRWYSQAAAQGDETAQNNLGVMYQNGQGVIRNLVEAYKWYCLPLLKATPTLCTTATPC